MAKTKGATKARKEERVNFAVALLGECVSSTQRVIKILQQEFGITERTAKRDLKKAKAMVRALGNSNTEENIGSLHNILNSLYAQVRSTNRDDILLCLQVIDRKTRLLSIAEKIGGAELQQRRSTHEPSPSTEDELEALLQLFAKDGKTEQPQDP